MDVDSVCVCGGVGSVEGSCQSEAAHADMHGVGLEEVGSAREPPDR